MQAGFRDHSGGAPDGLGGEFLNVVKPYGIYGHAIFGFALFCLFVVFRIWVKTCAKARDRVAPVE